MADPGLVFAPDAAAGATRLVLFQGLLEGHRRGRGSAPIACSRELGAPPLRSVRTVGGGAANLAWMEIRARLLGVPMLPPVNLEAGYGAALLARGRLVRPAGLAELAAFSAELGRDPEQVQAAGGNTSLKEDGVLWVKASGLWLADALTRDIFVPVALDAGPATESRPMRPTR